MIRILFMGRKPVAAKCLSWLLENKSVEVIGVMTDSHLSVSPTQKIASDAGIPTFSFSEALEKLRKGELDHDLGISMLYWRKLKAEFLTTPKLGVINFHPAPLPEYKGTAGYNLAILNALDTWAATAHYVDEEIDTGSIIEVHRFPICKETETAKSLEKTSQGILFELFVKTLGRAISNDVRLPTTPNIGGRYVSRIEMESMKEIVVGDDIARKIRAFWFPPYHGAYIVIDGQKFTLADEHILSTLADPASSNLFTKAAK